MDVTAAAGTTGWARGRFDAQRGPRQLLFGRMYEDAAIERAAFAPGGRVFCIASAGCTALALAPDHDVAAVDLNPVQLAYAAGRIAGDPVVRGTAERLMAAGRAAAPLVGWSRAHLRALLDLDEPAAQLAYWRAHLDTRRFRAAFDGLLSVTALRAVYATPLLVGLPRRLGAVMRARLERGLGRHGNRDNVYLRALLLGDAPDPSPPLQARTIQLEQADAAEYLERAPAASFDGFTLSNILDGGGAAYRRRLFAAIRRAAAPGAVVILRSFAEPRSALARERAGADRAAIWGSVEVRPAADDAWVGVNAR